MQNAGQQYGQGGASSHPTAPFNGHSENTTSGGSITSSLRQFRRKNEDKQSHTDGSTPATPSETHVARVAPHNHYPPRPTAECYRYPNQYPDYGLQQPVKYSEISEPHPPLQEHISPSVIQKTKSKEYMEMCNIQQQQMKPTYDHLNGQQTYPDANVHPHAQYLHKEPQVHHGYKPESQYYPKDPQYSPQHPHQLPKYTQMSSQVRKYPPENDFLSKLRRINPTMARSIMSDHHLQESQSSYQTMDQNRMYPLQNQRYMNYPSGMQNGAYTHGYMPYSNYSASCSYNRPPQMTSRFPPGNPHERSISPRRGYSENMGIPMNYGGIASQKVSPNYPQYNTPEYAQHYQHRRAPMPQEYYQQHCRTPQYLPHQMPPQEMSESRVTVSDSIKHYIENWADEETASEMNQIENSRLCKDNIRGREDQTTETVYMINTSELQYLENEIPLVASENGVPVVASESGQYIIKSGVSIVNGSEMMRLVEKTGQVEIDHNGERVVNLHIMDTTKPDCMLANKPNELNQRELNETIYPEVEKPRVVVHQNTVIAAGIQNPNLKKDSLETLEDSVKIGTSLPIITDTLEEELNRTIIKETADKNCSPINLDQLEQYREQEESCLKSSEQSLVEEIASIQEIPDLPKNISFIDAHLSNDDSKTDNEEHQTCNLEVDDPHKHIDTLLEDTANTSEAIETQTQEFVLEETQVKNNADKKDKTPLANLTKNEVTPNISNKDNLVPEKNEKDETELKSINRPNISEDVCHKPINQKLDEEDINDSQKSCSSLKVKHIKTTEERVVSEVVQDLKEIIKDDNAEILDKQDNAKDTKLQQYSAIPKIESLNENDNILPKSIVLIENSLTKRTKRIFSVDDIMNNIGKKLKSSNNDPMSRRHSLQTTKEFLDKEIKNTEFITQKINALPREKPYINKEHINKNTEKSPQCTISIEKKDHVEEVQKVGVMEESNKETAAQSDKIKNDLKSIVRSTSIIEDPKPTEVDTSHKNNNLIKKQILNLGPTVETEALYKNNNINEPENSKILAVGNSEEIENTTKSSKILPDLKNIENDNIFEDVPELVLAEDTTVPVQPEVQYRNVIRVVESCVLLEIAGELVEINVNNVNGKNIITVVPLSDTAVVDFNDNYETYDNSEAADPLRLDQAQDHNENLEVLDFVEAIPEPEVVETTGEIIIGMDLSLEEEIKLDVDEPPVIFTKAAKKAYDCDLQIPSITTSEDVLDNNRSNKYTPNDKVSSTKEKSKSKKNQKKTRPDSSKMVNLSKRMANKPDKKSLFRDLIAARNKKKLKQEPSKPEDDDFVPFKELIRARKLKKLKQLKLRNTEDSRVDSTIKIDETPKETKEFSEQDRDHDADKKIKIQKIPSMINVSLEDEHPNKSIVKVKHSDNVDKTEISKENSIQPKIVKAKRVSFSDLSQEIELPEDKIILERRQSEENLKNEIKECKLEYSKMSEQSAITKSAQTKKKLSLEEYIKRKRKLQECVKDETEEIKKIKIDRTHSVVEFGNNPEKIKPHRHKSLDDLNQLKSKECSTKRKLSVEYSPVKQNYFDWEETQSPKMNLTPKDQDNKLNEFKGLIGERKTKPRVVIDVNDFNFKPSTESSEDEILQNYKVQVESKLNALNIQIPRVKHPERQILDPFTKSETNCLIERFLKNEKLSSEEMEKIRKIISYKRLVQQLKKIKSPDLSHPSNELRKEIEEKETKLLIKKIRDKKKARFRNLNSQSVSESDEDLSEDPRCGDYSVVQSNCLAGVVPKLIIKRKTEMPIPVVRLERLNLGLFDDKNGRFTV